MRTLTLSQLFYGSFCITEQQPDDSDNGFRLLLLLLLWLDGNVTYMYNIIGYFCLQIETLP